MLIAVRMVLGVYQVLRLTGGGTGGWRWQRKGTWSSHLTYFYTSILSSFSLWALMQLPPLCPSDLCGCGPLSVRTSSNHPHSRVAVLLCPLSCCCFLTALLPAEGGSLAVLLVLFSGHRPCLACSRCLVNVLKKSGAGKLVW